MDRMRQNGLLMLAHVAKADDAHNMNPSEFVHDMIHHLVVGQQEAAEWAFDKLWNILADEYRWSGEGLVHLADMLPKED